jgi:hypothetical protein
MSTVQQWGRKESINWPPHGCLNPCVYAGLCARELRSCAARFGSSTRSALPSARSTSNRADL